MECNVDLDRDIVTVFADNKETPLRLSINEHYCKLFETTRDQSRDYLEEVVRWCGCYPTNFDRVSKNLMHYTAARRKMIGLEE